MARMRTKLRSHPGLLLNRSALEYLYYSVRRAVTGSFLAAFLEGIHPPISVNIILSRTRITAPVIGRTAFTSVAPVSA